MNGRPGKYQSVSSYQGLDPAEYAEHGVAHVDIPLRVKVEASAEQAEEILLRAAPLFGAIVDRLDGVEWITDHAESAYAIVANALTALQDLEPDDLALVLKSSAAREPLLKLLGSES